MAGAGNDRVDAGLKKLLDKAVDLDRRGRRKEACQHYLTASKVLIKLSKSASLPAVRKFYFDRAQECVDRVRYLSGIKKKTGKPRDGLRVPPSPISDTPSSTQPMDSRANESEADEESLRLHETITDTILTERPTVRMDDVAGLEEAKQAVYEAIAAPLKHPELFKGKARQPWKGILLYGPAGCGKTLVAKAVAGEVDATFFSVSAANIVSKWLGESEKLVSTLFSEARKNQPSIIFIDELDSVGVARSGEDVGGERRLKTQLLTELEGLGSSEDDRITLIGATNLPWELDFALRSRFEKKIHVPLPDKTARVEIFRIHMEEIDVASDVDYDELADLSEGYSGRDISVVCREAAMEAIRDLQRTGRIDTEDMITDLRPVTRSDFVKAIDNIRPATSPEDVGRYMDWAEGS
ncbi:MAG: AAA family ATPase [Candidatus Thorarchaeota archaeon]|nr:MAG: AAA family ATPase [Candidatus Thorarchaeota archaeon]